MQAETLSGGFDDPSIQSAHAFRSIMDAMARPGTLQAVVGAKPPAPLSDAAGSVLLTLCDADTPVYLAGAVDNAEVRAWIAFHTGAPLSGPSRCMFALGTWEELLPLSAYPVGTSEYPDRSATLIVECAELSEAGATLEGPGIEARASLSVPDVPALQANSTLYPLGLDFILTSGQQLAALPRTTKVWATDPSAIAQEGAV